MSAHNDLEILRYLYVHVLDLDCIVYKVPWCVQPSFHQEHITVPRHAFLGMNPSIRKISARVFCQIHGGGNPVSIFVAEEAIEKSLQMKLASSCAWESVMVDTSAKRLSFFMPTGEEVNFCAHAAMGGLSQLSSSLETPVSFTTASGEAYQGTVHADDIVSLERTADFQETKVTHPPALQRLLRDCHGLEASDLVPKYHDNGPIVRYPTFVNASVARPKTLVYVRSLEALHRAKAPPVDNDNYRIACDALGTTGLYLYTPVENDGDDDGSLVVECRQFPRASGYPEDPATGIAAAALAWSLHKTGIRYPSYKCLQGTAMNQPSLLLVEPLTEDKKSSNVSSNVSFRLTGRMERDE